MKEILIVGAGSFVGGSLRYVICKLIQQYAAGGFPLGTIAVNVIGCFVVGLLSGLNWSGCIMSPTTKLLLTTGFCGGFTTFSTFMNESAALGSSSHYATMLAYMFGSLALGFAAVLAGYWLAKC